MSSSTGSKNFALGLLIIIIAGILATTPALGLLLAIALVVRICRNGQRRRQLVATLVAERKRNWGY